MVPWHNADNFKHINAGYQTVETSVGPTATTEDQSSSDRNARLAAGSFTDHSQQPVEAQGMLSKDLPPESAFKSPQGSCLLTECKSLPQGAEQDLVSGHTPDGTEVVRRQRMLQSQHAQHECAPQHAERRQHAQRAGHSIHAGFTATVSMTARCRQQSSETWNSHSSVVSHCCATVHSPEVTGTLSIHATLSPRNGSKAVKHGNGRQGELANQSALMTDQHHMQEQLPKQSLLMPGQRECVPAQVQLQQQLPNQSFITIGQHETTPAQLHSQLQEQLPMQASPCATHSPQHVASHGVQQQVSRTVSQKSLFRASSIVAAQQAQQAVSRSSSTVRADAHSQLDSQRKGPKLSRQTLSQKQAEAVSCTSPVQAAEQLEPVCSESSAGSTGQLLSQISAGSRPVEPKLSLPTVLSRVSSQSPLTNPVSAGQGRAWHDGRGAGRTQPPGPQAELSAVPCNDSTSSARHGPHIEGSARHGAHPESIARHEAHTEGSSAAQLQLTALPRSDSASSTVHSMHHTDSCQAQPQLQQLTDPASTQGPQLQKGMSSGSRSSSMQVNSQSDLYTQQEVSPPGSSNSIPRLFLQSSFTAQQPDRLSRQKLLLATCSAQQDVAAQPECHQDHEVSRAEGLRAEGLGAEGLALLQEQSQLALATQASYSELSREGLEEDNCRLRRALAAIEQQLGMIRNQQVTKPGHPRS